MINKSVNFAPYLNELLLGSFVQVVYYFSNYLETL